MSFYLWSLFGAVESPTFPSPSYLFVRVLLSTRFSSTEILQIEFRLIYQVQTYLHVSIHTGLHTDIHKHTCRWTYMQGHIYQHTH